MASLACKAALAFFISELLSRCGWSMLFSVLPVLPVLLLSRSPRAAGRGGRASFPSRGGARASACESDCCRTAASARSSSVGSRSLAASGVCRSPPCTATHTHTAVSSARAYARPACAATCARAACACGHRAAHTRASGTPAKCPRICTPEITWPPPGSPGGGCGCMLHPAVPVRTGGGADAVARCGRRQDGAPGAPRLVPRTCASTQHPAAATPGRTNGTGAPEPTARRRTRRAAPSK